VANIEFRSLKPSNQAAVFVYFSRPLGGDSAAGHPVALAVLAQTDPCEQLFESIAGDEEGDSKRYDKYI
jgi:hypothetical protein